jgi:hypothetical protein
MKYIITNLHYSFYHFPLVMPRLKIKNQSLQITSQKLQVVEASCGQCNFAMKEKGCTLAVRIDGKAYFVDGTDIDSHGGSHDDDGFCNAIRKAEVKGEVVNNRFKASYFKLLRWKKRKIKQILISSFKLMIIVINIIS